MGPEPRLVEFAWVTCMLTWVIAGCYVLLWIAAFQCEGCVQRALVQSGRSAGFVIQGGRVRDLNGQESISRVPC